MTLSATQSLHTLHPDDVLFFAEVAAAMRTLALRRGLPLKTVTHLPDEHLGIEDTDRWGDCDREGNVRLLLRAKTPIGEWIQDPLSPGEVWRTAAHELAHLRYRSHGPEHAELEEDLLTALTAQQEDHRGRVLRKLVKMQAQRDSEAKIGNQAAAEAFAAAINRMLLEHELHPTDIDYARAQADDPITEVRVDLPRYGMPERKARSAWQEQLARKVANAHLCRFLIKPRTNQVWFVGTKSHATVAEYAYGTLVASAEKIADAEWMAYRRMCEKAGDPSRARGFRQSWLAAFVERIAQRFDEERARVVVEDAARRTTIDSHDPLPGASPTALIRLEGALVKAQQYIDNKFRGRATPLGGYYGHNHSDGRAWGRAAADRMTIGRSGIAGATTKVLGEGR